MCGPNPLDLRWLCRRSGCRKNRHDRFGQNPNNHVHHVAPFWSYWATTLAARARFQTGATPRQPCLATTRVREAPIPHLRFFNFLVQQRGPSRRRRDWRRLAEPTVPPALPRRPSYAVTAAGRRCLRSAVGVSGVFSLSIFRLDFRLARWCSLSIGGGSRPARAIEQ